MHASGRRRKVAAAVLSIGVVGALPMLGSAASAATVPAGSAAKTAPPVNLIRDAGAEGAKPVASGSKVPVRAWKTTANDNFTAVAYGAPSFPTRGSPGPKRRGRNFFAGGQSGNSSTGSQDDSLRADGRLIRSGHARFTLSAWLGGYSSQRDHAVLRITWMTAGGASLGTASIGPVSAAQRKDITGLRFRSTAGAVPRRASSVLVTLHMVRTDGEYVDGYADNLRLTVHR